ncbi:hypothetical protein QJQ45_015657, partial [Haematococcus lacustris]
MNSALETAAHLQNQDVEASNKSTGGRFGGGDMHEHLIQMGKQLAEIEAEHHQLFSGRQTDRDNLAKATARYFSGVQSRVDPLAGGLSPQLLRTSHHSTPGTAPVARQRTHLLRCPSSPTPTTPSTSGLTPSRVPAAATTRSAGSHGRLSMSHSTPSWASSSSSARRSLQWDHSSRSAYPAAVPTRARPAAHGRSSCSGSSHLSHTATSSLNASAISPPPRQHKNRLSCDSMGSAAMLAVDAMQQQGDAGRRHTAPEHKVPTPPPSLSPLAAQPPQAPHMHQPGSRALPTPAADALFSHAATAAMANRLAVLNAYAARVAASRQAAEQSLRTSQLAATMAALAAASAPHLDLQPPAAGAQAAQARHVGGGWVEAGVRAQGPGVAAGGAGAGPWAEGGAGLTAAPQAAGAGEVRVYKYTRRRSAAQWSDSDESSEDEQGGQAAPAPATWQAAGQAGDMQGHSGRGVHL